MSVEPMIQCENLIKPFGHIKALDHVSFAVGKGSSFGFLGPNGSGKSTVSCMICGLREPRASGFPAGGVSLQTVRVEVQTVDRVTSRREARLGPWAI